MACLVIESWSLILEPTCEVRCYFHLIFDKYGTCWNRWQIWTYDRVGIRRRGASTKLMSPLNWWRQPNHQLSTVNFEYGIFVGHRVPHARQAIPLDLRVTQSQAILTLQVHGRQKSTLLINCLICKIKKEETFSKVYLCTVIKPNVVFSFTWVFVLPSAIKMRKVWLGWERGRSRRWELQFSLLF
jgi:hypothetical protein